MDYARAPVPRQNHIREESLTLAERRAILQPVRAAFRTIVAVAVENTVRVASIEGYGCSPIASFRGVRRPLAAPLASVHDPITAVAGPGNHRAPTPVLRNKSFRPLATVNSMMSRR